MQMWPAYGVLLSSVDIASKIYLVLSGCVEMACLIKIKSSIATVSISRMFAMIIEGKMVEDRYLLHLSA